MPIQRARPGRAGGGACVVGASAGVASMATDLARGGPLGRVLAQAREHGRPDRLGQARRARGPHSGRRPSAGAGSPGRPRRAPAGRERQHGAERERGRDAAPAATAAAPPAASAAAHSTGHASCATSGRVTRTASGARQLGRQVPRRAVPGPGRPGEAEPDQARALLGEHDRRRREVAVREAARVHGGEPGRQPLGQRRRARIPQRAALVDELLQRGARDVHLGPPRRIGRGVDVHDGRHEPQRGRGGGPGLRGEPLPEPGARRDGRVHEREHDGAAGRVRAEQRAADRAVREQPHDLVGPERGGVVRRAHYSSIREPMTTVRSTGRQK